jgi:hypothetical protein
MEPPLDGSINLVVAERRPRHGLMTTPADVKSAETQERCGPSLKRLLVGRNV